jgi:hypothetical protein
MAAQETLSLILTSGGVVNNVGSPQDTLSAWIQTKALDFNQPSMLSYGVPQGDRFPKFIDVFVSHVARRVSQPNLQLEIYGSDDEDALGYAFPASLMQVVPLASNDPIFPDVPAFRYFKFLWRDNGVRERWRLHRFEVIGEPLGDEF